MSIDPNLSPADAAVTLRSLPRRYRAAFAAVGEDERPDDIAHRLGPAGVAAVDHLASTTAALALLDRAVEQTQTSDDAIIAAGVVDPSSRSLVDQTGSGTGDLDRALDDLEEAATTFAGRVEHIAASGWSREARVTGRDTPVRAIDLLRRAVDEAITNLRAAEQTLAAVRR